MTHDASRLTTALANHDVSLDGQRLPMVRSYGIPEYQVGYGWGTELLERMRTGGAQ
jgi:hypothetical protein